jgi:SAM-dependent methyltransferase
MALRPADWQLPAGVTRGLWDYLNDERLARGYDGYLAGSPLTSVDVAFVQRHCERPGRLIDLGCGTGRLLIAMARRGHWVLGVDLAAGMLRVSGEKAKAAGVEIHRLRANLVELEGLADGSFDYAACLFSTLGMVAGRENRCRVVAHVQRLLRPGGKFILHVHNRWFDVWTRGGRWALMRDLGRALTGRDGVGDRVMPAHLGIAGLTLHMFTRREVLRLLRATGFRVAEVRALGLGPDGRLARGWWLGRVRAYGYLIAAEKAAPI